MWITAYAVQIVFHTYKQFLSGQSFVIPPIVNLPIQTDSSKKPFSLADTLKIESDSKPSPSQITQRAKVFPTQSFSTKESEIKTPTTFVTPNNTQPIDDEKERPIHFVKHGGEYCENYLLKKIAKEKSKGSKLIKLESKEPPPAMMGLSAENSPIVKLEVFQTDNKALSGNLERWLEDRNIENLVAFQLRHKAKKALILGSTNLGATGVASNFENWHIRSDDYSVEFLSLSENPKLIFWDKDGLLNYYLIDLSDKFWENKDWNNLTLDLFRYRISPDGSAQLVSEEQNVRCG